MRSESKSKIKLFVNKQVRAIWDEETEKWWFSIVDIVNILTDSPEPRKYWSVLKTRLKKESSELATNCSQLQGRTLCACNSYSGVSKACGMRQYLYFRGFYKMKRLGLIGGLGPASTVDYYNEIINGYMAKTAIDNYPEIIINSLNMTEIISIIERNDLNGLANILTQAINVLDNVGADFAAIASNTPHIVFDKVSKQSALPLISIVDETCKFAKSMKYKKVFIIGTLFTMRSSMYTNAFGEYNIFADVPSEKEQEEIYSLFYPNLENGIVIPEDKEKMLNLLSRILSNRKYDALVLGCTELPLMIKTHDLDIPLINTTQIHIDSIINYLVDSRT